MATVKAVSVNKADREKTLEAYKAKDYTSLSGNELPLGNHKFVVADKKAFGILDIITTKDGKEAKYALPIVAGKLITESGQRIDMVIDSKTGSKTLVVPDRFFIQMEANTTYGITVEKRNGRNVVTAVEAGVEELAPAEDED